jgi:molybdenum cofactor guanylyltransferase
VTGPREAIAGAILAGGRNSRMGRDKALLPLNGQPMIQHVAAAMCAVIANVCIVSDRPEPYRFLNLPVIPDRTKDAGPLAGVHAALATLDAPAIITAGCDTPFLSPSLLRYLLDAPHTSPALVARTGNSLHPLCAVYHREALPLIEQFLAARRFRLRDVLEELKADILDITPDLPFYHPSLLVNVNDPSAYSCLTDSPMPGKLP